MAKATCQKDGCAKQAWARGLCSTHYAVAWKRAHDYRTRYDCVCIVCAKPFQATTRTATFCSTGAGSCEARYRSIEYRSRDDIGRPQLPQTERLRRFTDHLLATTRVDVGAYKRAVRADPCAYCGQQPSNGIDHIEPTGSDGDRNDWTNWTACCKRCNETKRTLPLLTALPWIPLSRAYHEQRRAIFARQIPGVDH